MSFEDTQDFAPSNALHLSDTMRVTQDDADLRRSQPLLSKLADVLLNLREFTTVVQIGDRLKPINEAVANLLDNLASGNQ